MLILDQRKGNYVGETNKQAARRPNPKDKKKSRKCFKKDRPRGKRLEYS